MPYFHKKTSAMKNFEEMCRNRNLNPNFQFPSEVFIVASIVSAERLIVPDLWPVRSFPSIPVQINNLHFIPDILLFLDKKRGLK